MVGGDIEEVSRRNLIVTSDNLRIQTWIIRTVATVLFCFMEKIMPVMKIVLQNDEQIALHRLADRELRDPRAQATLIIRHELQKQGLLTVDDETTAVSHLETRE